MKRKNCGQDNPPEVSFCTNCGAALFSMIKTFSEIGVFSPTITDQGYRL
jgi:hypothetical protein